jgi:hypothetical protein
MTQHERNMQALADRDARRLASKLSEIDKKPTVAETVKMVFMWVIGLCMGLPLALLAFAHWL